MKNIYKALLRVSEKTSEAIKASERNAMYNHKYATIYDIMEAIGDSLKANNLVFESKFSYQNECWGVLSQLIYVPSDDGEVEMVESFFPGDRLADPQQMGKIMTYGRRYNLVSLLNLRFKDDEDDDDGAGLTTTKTKPKLPKVAL